MNGREAKKQWIIWASVQQVVDMLMSNVDENVDL